MIIFVNRDSDLVIDPPVSLNAKTDIYTFYAGVLVGISTSSKIR